MPKPKRYENLRNSVHSTSTSQGVAQSSSTNESETSHLDDTSFLHQKLNQNTSFLHQKLNQNLHQQQLTSFLQPTPQPTHFDQATTQLNPSVQIITQLIPSTQATSQSKPPKNCGGRESMQYWTVDAIDLQGTIKKLKVKKRDILNLSSGERIVVDFDDMDSPIGEGQGILARFCGILAADCSIFPIHFEKWSDLPATYFNRCFDQFIKPRFCLRTSESNGRRYVYNSMCKKWGAKRLKRFDRIYDPLKSRIELMDEVPTGIPRDQWVSYVDYRLKEKTMEMCKRNAENRKQQVISHIGGSKPNSRRRAEMKAETGKNPGRGQLYLATHKNEDGTYVNEAAKEICEKIELAMTQSITDESEISSNDVIGKVLGKEHSGRVRCLGLGVVPSRAFKQTRPRYSDLNASSYNNSCSSQCQEKYNLMMNAHTQLVNAFKTYMIMKEGTIPEQFAGIFVSPAHSAPSDAASGSISPMNVRRSSDGSNPNDNQ